MRSVYLPKRNGDEWGGKQPDLRQYDAVQQAWAVPEGNVEPGVCIAVWNSLTTSLNDNNPSIRCWLFALCLQTCIHQLSWKQKAFLPKIPHEFHSGWFESCLIAWTRWARQAVEHSESAIGAQATLPLFTSIIYYYFTVLCIYIYYYICIMWETQSCKPSPLLQ